MTGKWSFKMCQFFKLNDKESLNQQLWQLWSAKIHTVKFYIKVQQENAMHCKNRDNLL